MYQSYYLENHNLIVYFGKYLGNKYYTEGTR